jgi:hypothetical protein
LVSFLHTAFFFFFAATRYLYSFQLLQNVQWLNKRSP